MRAVILVQILMGFVELLQANDRQSCIEALKITTDAKGTPDESHENYICLTMCVYKKSGLLNVDGNFDLWKFKDIYRPFIDTCEKKIRAVNDCDRIKKFEDCIRTEQKASFEMCTLRSRVSPRKISQEVLPKVLGDGAACYQHCVYKQYKIINGDNTVNTTQLEKYLPKGFKVEGALKKCEKATNQTDTCVRMLHVLQCVSKALNRKYTNVERECFKKLEIKTDVNGLPSPTDPKLKCMRRCYYLKYGLINANGTIVPVAFNRYYSPVLQVCAKNMTEGDECSKIANFNKCLWPESINMRRQCANETNLKQFLFGTIPKIVDEKNACYYRCVYRRYHFINDKDEIDAEGIKVYLKQSVHLDNLIKKCQNGNNQANKCVKAVSIVQCINNFFQHHFNN